MLGTYRAIVTDVAGTTRELLVDEGQIWGITFEIYDSPWLENFWEEQQFIQKIIDTADLLIFVADRNQWINMQDETIAELIFRAGKKADTIVVVNKLEHKVFSDSVYEYLSDWYSLGFQDIFPLSAKQGDWVEFLLEEIVKRIRGGDTSQHPALDTEDMDFDEEIEEQSLAWLSDIGSQNIPFVIVWRPNTGKSTLMNALVGDYVAHVQDKPGTTLDYIKSKIVEGKTTFELYDTAGIRKHAKIVWLERIAYEKTKKLIAYIKPIIVLMIDGVEGVTQRDLTILGEMIALGHPLVIALNKADTFDTKAYHDMRRISMALGDYDWITVCTISAKEKTWLTNLMQTIRRTWKLAHERLDTPKLNDVLKTARIQSPPRFPKNKICKRKYITQTGVIPTTFYMSVNNKDFANFSFIRWCENVIRKSFWLQGVPFQFSFSSKVLKNPFLKKNQWQDDDKK